MKIVGITLIVIGGIIGFIGASKLTANTRTFNFLGIEIDASNEAGQTTGILYLVGSAILIGGGGVLARKNDN